jgi:hypothetical protein
LGDLRGPFLHPETSDPRDPHLSPLAPW